MHLEINSWTNGRGVKVEGKTEILVDDYRTETLPVMDRDEAVRESLRIQKEMRKAKRGFAAHLCFLDGRRDTIIEGQFIKNTHKDGEPGEFSPSPLSPLEDA